MMESIAEKPFWNVLKTTVPYWDEMSNGQRGALLSFDTTWARGSLERQVLTVSACLRDKAWDEVPAAFMLCSPSQQLKQVSGGGARPRADSGTLDLSVIAYKLGVFKNTELACHVQDQGAGSRGWGYIQHLLPGTKFGEWTAIHEMPRVGPQRYVLLHLQLRCV